MGSGLTGQIRPPDRNEHRRSTALSHCLQIRRTIVTDVSRRLTRTGKQALDFACIIRQTHCWCAKMSTFAPSFPIAGQKGKEYRDGEIQTALQAAGSSP
jgi:hypothetical protein